MVKEIIIDTNKCNGDGICVDTCPVNVYELDAKSGKAKVINLEDCIECLACEENCPEGAIKIIKDE
jgi:NAD-dependent dihydropyrimidine dehydrogenase PreA subunit